MMTVGLLVLAAVVIVAALIAWNLCVFRRAPLAPGRGSVSILLPARNEAAGIADAVGAACAHAGDVEVIVLDDDSTDATPEILAGLQAQEPRLTVVPGWPLPRGWAGKAWACWQAARHARHEWLLFVDCDVRLAPDAAWRAIAAARMQHVAFLSAFPRQVTPTIAEALVVPLIHLVLLAYLPIALVRRSRRPSLSAACGQFMLVRRADYFAAGGHRAVRGSLHDGVMLSRHMKASGFAVGLVDGTDLASCRMYAGLVATWRGFVKNAYEPLGSVATLAAVTALNVTLFIAPFAGLVAAATAGLSASVVPWVAAAALVVAARWALAVRFDHPRWTALATPLAVALMVAIQWHAFVNHRTGRRVEWRRRAYAPVRVDVND